jgi:hypothetical protein
MPSLECEALSTVLPMVEHPDKRVDSKTALIKVFIDMILFVNL